MENSAKSYNLSLTDSRAWLVAGLFVAGNLIVPQLFHLIPGGGAMFGPIYYLTLIAAMRYGPGVGLMTAFLSPVANNLLFGMPPDAVLPTIIIKSVALALAACYFVKLMRKA